MKLLTLSLILFTASAAAEVFETEVRHNIFGMRDYCEVVQSTPSGWVRQCKSVAAILFKGDSVCLFHNGYAQIIGRRCKLRQGGGCTIRDYVMECVKWQ